MKNVVSILLLAVLSAVVVQAGRPEPRQLQQRWISASASSNGGEAFARAWDYGKGDAGKTVTFGQSEDDDSFDDQPEAPSTSEDDKEWLRRQERDMPSDAASSEDKPTTDDSQQAQWPFGDSQQGRRRSGNKWQDIRDSRDNQEDQAPSSGQQDQTQTSDQQGSQDTSNVNDADLRSVLDTHNRFRARHGTPPLSWSTSIAASAQAYSENCVFEHSRAKGLGENLSSGYRNWAAAIKAWMEDEEGLYDHSRPGFAKATGHYTQVVWRSTTELGCGSSPCGGRTLVH